MCKSVRFDIGYSALNPGRQMPDRNPGRRITKCLLDQSEAASQQGRTELAEHLLMCAWQLLDDETGII
jgi:hypothetical protein